MVLYGIALHLFCLALGGAFTVRMGRVVEVCEEERERVVS